MGWRYKNAGQGMDSSLAAHVANELKNETAIAKESRKSERRTSSPP
jgi:hypothetical protein